MKSFFILLFPLAFLLSSCNSKLSRSEAETLIKNKVGFPYVTKDEIPRHYIIPVYENWNWDNEGVIGEEWEQKMQTLHREEVIELTEMEKTIPPGHYGAGYVTWWSCDVTLTPAGDKFYCGEGSKSFKFYGGNVKTIVVRVHENEFDEITGIVEAEQPVHAAQVTYTVKKIRPTPFNEIFQVDLTEKKKFTAHFVKYDDGWRLESINEGAQSLSEN